MHGRSIWLSPFTSEKCLLLSSHSPIVAEYRIPGWKYPFPPRMLKALFPDLLTSSVAVEELVPFWCLPLWLCRFSSLGAFWIFSLSLVVRNFKTGVGLFVFVIMGPQLALSRWKCMPFCSGTISYVYILNYFLHLFSVLSLWFFNFLISPVLFFLFVFYFFSDRFPFSAFLFLLFYFFHVREFFLILWLFPLP